MKNPFGQRRFVGTVYRLFGKAHRGQVVAGNRVRRLESGLQQFGCRHHAGYDARGLGFRGTNAAACEHHVHRKCFADWVDQEASMLALVRSGVGLSLARDSLAMRENQSAGLVIANKVKVEARLTFVCKSAARERTVVAAAWNALGRVWHR